MQSRVDTYFNIMIPKWLWIIIILLDVGRYSSYIQPVDSKEPIEVLTYIEDMFSSQDIVLYTDLIDQKKNDDYVSINYKYLTVVSLHHSKLYKKIEKNQSFLVSLQNLHKFFTIHYNSSYDSEEGSFHFNINSLG